LFSNFSIKKKKDEKWDEFASNKSAESEKVSKKKAKKKKKNKDEDDDEAVDPEFNVILLKKSLC
jgi:hypothetical protein